MSAKRAIRAVLVTLALTACTEAPLTVPDSLTGPALESRADRDLDRALTAALDEWGFTGRIASTLERRIGRRIDRELDTVVQLGIRRRCSCLVGRCRGNAGRARAIRACRRTAGSS